MKSLKSTVKKLTLPYLKPKYYFVGLTATGNRTAGKAMTLLGYKWIHFPMALEDTWSYEVVTDTPVALWFRQGLLPGNGKFILTIRDLEGWLNDCYTWFESAPLSPAAPSILYELRQYLYQGLAFDRSRFIDAYHQHNQECEAIAKKMGVELYKWNVVENPTWDFLTQLTGKTCNQAFPFTPGIYPKTTGEEQELRKSNPDLIPSSSDDWNRRE